MNALTVKNPHHKCDWGTRMTTDQQTILDYNNDYYMYTDIAIICIILICTYVCVYVFNTTYTLVLARVHSLLF